MGSRSEVEGGRGKFAAARLQPNGAAYAAAKAGLNAYSKALASEVAPHGVWVTAVLPGFIASSALDDVVGTCDQDPGAAVGAWLRHPGGGGRRREHRRGPAGPGGRR